MFRHNKLHQYLFKIILHCIH